jgi:hypothetical protein
MTIKATAADRRAVARFNLDHPVGTPVRYWPGFREGDGKVSSTRTPAELLSGHTPVVWVEDVASCIALTHIQPVVSPTTSEGATR